MFQKEDKRWINFNFSSFQIFILYTWCFPAYLSVHHVHVVSAKARREDVESPGTQVRDSCELLCRRWELKLSPGREQPALLTTEVSL